ncbi:glycosyltransferase family 4 protein [Thiococcus pfennigii]|uniref:glycosyltransferase family 4 protein n=1 Tax=Thiococcus pfennigii TaxID=1057 RepID=UPI00190523FA|nr:glycosyltransferase family 4 protein [Thiococcus pfennigii]MBK1699833.1 hypothetical protein [Thiococcus pfennigii]
MKIAFFSFSSLPSQRANSVFVMKMCQGFSKLGHETVLFVPRSNNAVPHDKIFDFYDVEHRFKIIQVPKPKFFGSGITYGLLCALKAKKMSVDLAYSRHLLSGFFSVKLGIPTILESHAPFKQNGYIYDMLFGYLLKAKELKGVAVITESLKKHYVQQYPLLKRKIFVVPDAADVPEGKARTQSLHGENDRFCVGYAGSLFKGKGIEVIIPLARLCQWATFHIVGGTQEQIDELKRQQDAPENVYFYGFREPWSINGYLRSFDVLLLPNQEVVNAGNQIDIGKWTSPMKLFEYMAAERPIIASDLPVIKEVLQHEKNALLCGPRDIACWVETLERLRDSPALGTLLSETALEDLKRNYTWKARARKILGYYSNQVS